MEKRKKPKKSHELEFNKDLEAFVLYIYDSEGLYPLYVKDVDSLMLWEGRYKELSAEVKKKEKREQFSGRGLSMRLG